MRNQSEALLLGRALFQGRTLVLGKILVPAVTLAVILTVAAPQVYADIVLDTAFPTNKQSARIHVTDDAGSSVPGAEVTVTYRPGSAVERSSVVGTTSATGTFAWTPSESGIATIAATWIGDDNTKHTTSVNTSVKFDPTPVSGIIIMIIAGIVLIGGGVERVISLLRRPEVE